MHSRFVQAVSIVFLLYGLFCGPILVVWGILSLLATFDPQASLMQVLGFPIFAFFTLVAAWCYVVILPKVVHPLFFAIASATHLCFGVSGMTSNDVYGISLGVIILVYSYWEFTVFCRPVLPDPASETSNPS